MTSVGSASNTRLKYGCIHPNLTIRVLELLHLALTSSSVAAKQTPELSLTGAEQVASSPHPLMSHPGETSNNSPEDASSKNTFIYPVRSLLSGIQSSQTPHVGTSSGGAQSIEGHGEQEGQGAKVDSLGDTEGAAGEHATNITWYDT